MPMQMLVNGAQVIQPPLPETHLTKCIGDVKPISGRLSLSKTAAYELNAHH